MAMRILAVGEGGKTHFIIGDGDPETDPMMLAQVAVLETEYTPGMLSPAVPLQQHFKFGTWEEPDDPDDQELLKRLLALPRVGR